MNLKFFWIALFLFTTSEVLKAEGHDGAVAVENFNIAIDLVEKKNFRDAVVIFSELSKQDFPEAQYNLSILYFNGLGAPKNFKLSLYWAWQAHLNNHEAAGKWMDNITSNITENLQNSVAQLIVDELTLAANEGDLSAPIKLGRTFLKLFVQPNNQMAYQWLSIAQAYGDEAASVYLEEAASQLTLEEILIEQDNALKAFNAIIESN